MKKRFVNKPALPNSFCFERFSLLSPWVLAVRPRGERSLLVGWFLPCPPPPESIVRDAEMTIKIIFERSSQKGGSAGVRKEGRQGTHLEILLSG